MVRGASPPRGNEEKHECEAESGSLKLKREAESGSRGQVLEVMLALAPHRQNVADMVTTPTFAKFIIDAQSILHTATSSASYIVDARFCAIFAGVPA